MDKMTYQRSSLRRSDFVFQTQILDLHLRGAMDWEQILNSTEVIKQIKAACRDRCRDEKEAAKCFRFVMIKLSTDHHRPLSSYNKESSLETYLNRIIRNLIFDYFFHSKKYDAILSSGEIIYQIDGMCHDRCYDENDYLECFNYVWDKLKTNNFRRLRAYRKSAAIQTYLYKVINHLISDFFISKYGKNRYPKVIEEMGEFAKAVYRLICWERYKSIGAYYIVFARGLFSDDYDTFEEEIIPILNAPCRRYIDMDLNREIEELPDPDGPVSIDDIIHDPENERRLMIAKLLRELTYELPHEDRLLFSLVFGSDIKVSKIARAWGKKPDALRGHKNQLFKRIRKRLLARLVVIPYPAGVKVLPEPEFEKTIKPNALDNYIQDFDLNDFFIAAELFQEYALQLEETERFTFLQIYLGNHSEKVIAAALSLKTAQVKKLSKELLDVYKKRLQRKITEIHDLSV